MAKPPEDNPAKGKRPTNWPAVVLCGFLMLLMYALSTGPVLWLVDREHLNWKTPSGRCIQGFYAPFNWAYDHTPLRKPMDAYIHLWVTPKKK
jgi:hypothetical protein